MADRPVLQTSSAYLSDRTGDRPPFRRTESVRMYPGNEDKGRKDGDPYGWSGTHGDIWQSLQAFP